MLFVIAQLVEQFIFPVALVLYVVIVMMLLIVAANLSLLHRRSTFIAQPNLFAKEVIDFIKAASQKGLDSKKAEQLLILLYKSEAFTIEEKEKISTNIANNLPATLVDIFHSYKNAKVQDVEMAYSVIHKEPNL